MTPRLAAALLLTASLAALSGPAGANDSTAELGIGGISLTVTANIEMLSEDLFISPDEVRVAYRFKNRTDKDIDTIVAFPIPEIPGGEEFYYYPLPVDDAQNFVGFTVTVDGKPVTPKVEQRATANNLDRTELLASLGIPIFPTKAKDALDRLPDDKKREFEKLGLAYPEEDYETKTTKLVPAWNLRTTFWWEQTFPAGREVAVSHTYKPVVGATAGLQFDPKTAAKDNPDYVKKYCMDKAFLDGVQKMDAAAKKRDTIAAEHRLSYVLTTGANWAGNIGAFRLVVDKGRPDALVSFCGDGVKKISPTQFEMKKTDFVPEDDLKILLVKTGE
ncbi:DUF4424 domain-containing protein [Blastochloris sulfoviridis]|uniref:DUF4424 domain-containing protein n=1 Tax=Blastochloris sulfoviridis TaxID=50712 RepID=A0A5M6I2V2_9HYPH|nr:DUF4424 domain-containing protein [Blastochloris sulfoviridis]KAA5602115.1 DUF4424 domain-containing protein [Blastochloris sulfoviridis]